MRKPRREYVYLMGSASSPIVKIGRSNNPKRRLFQVQEDVGRPLEVMWTTPGGKEMERGLHQHFAQERRHGEWFELGFAEAPALVAAVVAANDWETESFTMWKPRSTECTACDHAAASHGKDRLCNRFYGWGDDAERCQCAGYTLVRRAKRAPEPSALPTAYVELGALSNAHAVAVTYGRAS
jgi:hypothetical protein